MTATQGFITFLATTVVLLVFVTLTGWKAKRKQHLTLVALAVVSLAITIYWAEQLGEEYNLETAGAITPIHLWLAKITVVCYALPVITGIATIKNARRRLVHRKVAFLVLGLTLVTFLTGLAMILGSEPI